jgi:hypothetical protein
MTLEQRVDGLERRLSRYRSAMMVMALVLVAGVTMGQATNGSRELQQIRTRDIMIMNEDGEPAIHLTYDRRGNGMAFFMSGQGELLASIGTSTDTGWLNLNAADEGSSQGIVAVGRSDNGGEISLWNKTGEEVVQLYADEYGNGVVGAFNRKGKGRTLKPGP